jgi:VWFA-related protein
MITNHKYWRLSFRKLISGCLLLCLVFLSHPTRGQQSVPSRGSAEPDDDVIRINTDLVQTDIVVLDRQGRFIDGLKKEQFELRVDDKPQMISFFERIVTGSSAEERQLAAARPQPSGEAPVGRVPNATEYQRTAAFFVDDLHLGPEAILQTRKLLEKFVGNNMWPGDQVMIASASGQVGFLQQFTDSKAMLDAAISRLRYLSRSKLDNPLLSMTDYEALAVDRNEWSVINKKVNEIMATNYSLPTVKKEKLANLKAMAEREVRNTARQILQQATNVNKGMLTTLESLARGSARLRGRKVVFFISEGFVVDRRSTEVQDSLQRVIDAAARTGVVIYSVDARGLTAAFADASTWVPETESHVDTTSIDASVPHQVMRTLAADTGGRAILNSNNLDQRIAKVFDETSRYYLLAWRPEAAEPGKPRFHQLKVSIKGRPELTVLSRRGFFTSSPRPLARESAGNPTESSETLPRQVLNKQLNSPFARRDLPVSIYPSFTNDAQRGSVLTISAQLGIGYAPSETSSAQAADTDLVYVVLNDQGKTISGSARKLTALPTVDNVDKGLARFVSEFSLPIGPGLYQIRFAMRDNHDGRIGSAFDWIVIPKFEPKRLSLSTLLISEQKVAQSQENARPLSRGLILNLERTFAQTSGLLCQTYIYNAAQAGVGQPPQITMEINVFHQNRLIASVPVHSLPTGNLTDFARIPYAVPIPLKTMAAGHYTLQVTATDRITNSNATQTIDFRIE